MSDRNLQKLFSSQYSNQLDHIHTSSDLSHCSRLVWCLAVVFHWCVVLTIMPGMQLVCWAQVLAPACTVWPICQEAGGDIIIFIEIEGAPALHWLGYANCLHPALSFIQTDRRTDL